MIDRIFVSALVALPSILAAGCVETVEPEEKPDLNYELVTFSGESVPAVVQESSDQSLEILSGSFLLSPLGTCRSETRWQSTDGVDTASGTVELTCTWSGAGSMMTFSWDHGPESSGATDGALLTVILPTGLQCVTEPCPAEWTATYQFVPM